ncbi:hypothetical protein GGR56DRAFT_668381 [Xylariaceae sp. FL0804]|nr:hypothetical protein GGR56DRAFT_668381 [Xylariaceae sp. FL0804]
MFILSSSPAFIEISISLLALAFPGISAYSQSGSESTCRCFPGDCCWPSRAEWDGFNSTLHGKLIATVPIASPCHYNSFTPYNADHCDPFNKPSDECVLGTYVQYAVNASGLDDFQKTMEFAADREIRFLVRNTAHDYFGRSTGAGAPALWTHHMKDTESLDYHSRNYHGKAMKMGAGVQVMEALVAAQAQGLVVAGGQCQTVGVAGGYTQGGGHSFLASLIGLSADQVLEWEAVTATGEYLVATPFNNSDLYWALSGGGGGTFAATLSVTVKAYPDLSVAAGNLTFTLGDGVSKEAFFTGVKAWLLNLPALVDAGGAALWDLAEGYLSVLPVFGPNMTVSEVEALLSPTLTALNYSGISYTSYFHAYPSFLDAYNAMNPFEPVTDGNMGAYLLPRDLVTSEANASALTDTLDSLTTGAGVVTGGLSYNVARGQDITQPAPNSVNPTWRTIIHYLAFGLSYNRTSIAADTKQWKLITKEILSTRIWKQVFCGSHYDRLLDIKDKYDPNSLFYGLTSVGSDRWEVRKDGRLCKAQIQDSCK